MNQERSIFHSNGMPLRLSENRGAGRAQSSRWMSPFYTGHAAETLPHGGRTVSAPFPDAPPDQEEYAPEFSEGPEQAAVPEQASALPAGQRTEFPLPSSFSWVAEAHQPSFPLPSSSAESGQAIRSNRNLGRADQERSAGSIAADFSEPTHRDLPAPKTEPTAAGQARTASTASPITRKIRSQKESRRKDTKLTSAARSSSDSPSARAEVWGYRENLGMNAMESPRPAGAANSGSTLPAVKVTVSSRTTGPETESSRPTSVLGDSSMAGTFGEQKLGHEVATTTAARKTEALEVLEKLSSGGSQEPASPASGRRVHIGKLHITVLRPAGDASPQAPQAAEAQRASQPAGQVFFDPWEKHYSSLD